MKIWLGLLSVLLLFNANAITFDVVQINDTTEYSNKEIDQAIDNLVEFRRQQQLKIAYELQQAEYERKLAEWGGELKEDIKDNPNVRIGMTTDQVSYGSNWGLPDDISTYEKFELWIYGYDKYLYFTDGKLTSIHE